MPWSPQKKEVVAEPVPHRRKCYREGVGRAALLALCLVACDAPIELDDAGALDGGDRPADSGPTDAGPIDAGLTDAGLTDAGLTDAGLTDAGPPFAAPNEVFFVGNSFTFGGPVPTLVEQLAIYAGWPPPNVEYRAVPGRSLSWHRADDGDPEGAPRRVAEGWDVVVLQEQSTRPTDQLGSPDRFKRDATWFYDLARTANPNARVILYETWARRFDHSYYPGSFSDPAMMQAELRFHYYDAAERYIPTFSSLAAPHDVVVAPCGDAWELHLSDGESPRLHASDSWHASAAGAYLNALVIYATIYHSRTDGLIGLRGLDEATASRLQRSADRVSGARERGPLLGRVLTIAAGDQVRFDLGMLPVDGWSPLGVTRGTAGPAQAVSGEVTSALLTSWGFDGAQEGGRADNALAIPADVSRDTLWVGTFDGHAAALGREARVVLRGLPDGLYRVELFGSRDGDDGGRGRLTRYSIDGAARDLDVADNADRLVTFDSVAPDARGEIVIRVAVSPEGAARFAYLGFVRATRQ